MIFKDEETANPLSKFENKRTLFFPMADVRFKLAEPLPDVIPAKKPNPFAKGATIASLPPRRKSSKLLNAAAIEAARSKKSPLDKVRHLLKQATHGGEISPGWRTRDALVSNDRQRLSSNATTEKSSDSGHSPISLESPYSGTVGFSASRETSSSSSDPDQDVPEVLQDFWAAYPHMRRLPPEEFLEYDDMEVDGDESTACIGSGGQGQIWRCVHESSKHKRRVLAVKVSYKESVLEEYLIARRFNNKNLLKSVGFTVQPEYEVTTDAEGDKQIQTKWLFLVSYEYCAHGDLRAFFSKFPWRSRDEPFLNSLLKDLLKALEAIHSQGWIHCDIKPENILVHQDLSVRLGDFGMFQKVGERMKAQGTPSYLAPEVFDAWFRPRDPHSFTEKIDIFSLGVTMVAILTGKFPFGRVTARLRAFKPFADTERKTFFRVSSKRIREICAIFPGYERLVKSCLQEDPEDRPGASEILSAMSSSSFTNV